MAQLSLKPLFDEYGESHQNPVNVAVHWTAVPLIYFSVLGLLTSIPSPWQGVFGGRIWVILVLVAVCIFYARRSFPLAIGMVAFSALCVWIAMWLEANAIWPLWAICVGVFVVAWMAQFIGHGVEGKKPSFLKDLQFLLIGPAWLLAKLFHKAGIPY